MLLLVASMSHGRRSLLRAEASSMCTVPKNKQSVTVPTTLGSEVPPKFSFAPISSEKYQPKIHLLSSTPDHWVSPGYHPGHHPSTELPRRGHGLGIHEADLSGAAAPSSVAGTGGSVAGTAARGVAGG